MGTEGGLEASCMSKTPLRLEVAVQPNSAYCGFHVT
jgi:hypothetical protein